MIQAPGLQTCRPAVWFLTRTRLFKPCPSSSLLSLSCSLNTAVNNSFIHSVTQLHSLKLLVSPAPTVLEKQNHKELRLFDRNIQCMQSWRITLKSSTYILLFVVLFLHPTQGVMQRAHSELWCCQLSTDASLCLQSETPPIPRYQGNSQAHNVAVVKVRDEGE